MAEKDKYAGMEEGDRDTAIGLADAKEVAKEIAGKKKKTKKGK